MALKPWYQVVTPREDLRDGKPLDASEFAVHLDHVRDGRAPAVYQNPSVYFERTFLTKNLRELSAQVQAVREQLARTQEESDSLREAMALQEKAQTQMKRITPPAPSRTKPAELLPPLQESIAKAPEVTDPLMSDSALISSGRKTVQHVVKPGDTVFRLSRKYGTSVAKIREWNRLQDDIIEVGQKLIVGME